MRSVWLMGLLVVLAGCLENTPADSAAPDEPDENTGPSGGGSPGALCAPDWTFNTSIRQVVHFSGGPRQACFETTEPFDVLGVGMTGRGGWMLTSSLPQPCADFVGYTGSNADPVEWPDDNEPTLPAGTYLLFYTASALQFEYVGDSNSGGNSPDWQDPPTQSTDWAVAELSDEANVELQATQTVAEVATSGPGIIHANLQITGNLGVNEEADYNLVIAAGETCEEDGSGFNNIPAPASLGTPSLSANAHATNATVTATLNRGVGTWSGSMDLDVIQFIPPQE